MNTSAPSFIWLSDIDTANFNQNNHIRKTAELTQAQFPVAPSFVITEQAYFHFLKDNNLDHKIAQILSTIAIDRPDSLMQGVQYIDRLFTDAAFSDQFIDDFLEFYDRIANDVKLELHATGKQQVKHFATTVSNEKAFMKQLKKAWKSMFTAEALWHRYHQNLDHLRTGAVVLVQASLLQEKYGKAFTVEKNAHAKDTMTIFSKGDQYLLSKKNFTILDRNLQHKAHHAKLSHDELMQIAALAKQLENHLYFPQQFMWTLVNGQLFLIDTKPLTDLPKTPVQKMQKVSAARGTRVTPAIRTGVVKIIQSSTNLETIKHDHIVVLSDLKPKQFKQLKKAKGIISESGRPHTEIATLLRKHGIPTIFNVKNATKQFKNGHIITIHGDKAEIYRGGFS